MKRITRRANEELTADASVTDFITELSKCAADFIKTNRSAFNADDEKAVQELIDVFSVQQVRESILSSLQAEDTEQEDQSLADEVSDEEEQPEEEPKKEQNDDLVSDDVMALLDE